MMSSMLKMERFSLCQGNAMINAISEKDFISYFIIPRIIHLFYVFLFSVSFFHSEWAAMIGSLRVVHRPKPRLSFLFVCLYVFVDACGTRALHAM